MMAFIFSTGAYFICFTVFMFDVPLRVVTVGQKRKYIDFMFNLWRLSQDSLVVVVEVSLTDIFVYQ